MKHENLKCMGIMQDDLPTILSDIEVKLPLNSIWCDNTGQVCIRTAVFQRYKATKDKTA